MSSDEICTSKWDTLLNKRKGSCGCMRCHGCGGCSKTAGHPICRKVPGGYVTLCSSECVQETDDQVRYMRWGSRAFEYK